MEAEYTPWIALASGVVGMMIGYFMGYRTGKIAGELAVLKATRTRRERSRGSNRTSSGAFGIHDHGEVEELEISSGAPRSNVS